jgi:hypothetical protein
MPMPFPVRLSDERGQALALFALATTIFVALVGMAVDVGSALYTRTDLQKTADAAALAAAQDLPSTGAASSTALQYVSTNGGGGLGTVTTFTPSTNPTTVRVRVTKRVDFTFLRVVGISGWDVSAAAAASRLHFQGGRGILPWGLVASDNRDFLGNACFAGWASPGVPRFRTGTTCTIKYGAGDNSGGDFGALALDGTGASRYRASIANGSSSTFTVGQMVEVQTGNMQGPTTQGVNDRLALPRPSTCNTDVKDRIVSIDPNTGEASIRAGCENHPRIIIIPVVDKIANPQQSRIIGFAFMYLIGQSGSGGGSSVSVEFVNFTTTLPGGVYGASGTGSTAIRLIE